MNKKNGPMNTWIPVTERLPEKHDIYLIYADGPAGDWQLTARWTMGDGHETAPGWCLGAYTGINVTHWMPLPEPPK